MNKKGFIRLVFMFALMVLMMACAETTWGYSERQVKAHALGLIETYQMQHGTPTPEFPAAIPTFSANLALAAPTPSADALLGRIAFADYPEKSHWTINLIESDGVTITRLTDDKRETSPSLWGKSGIAWSPDGKKLAIVSDREGNNEIYVMNPDGSEEIRLTNNTLNDFSPVWSPDGEQILVITWDGENSEINKISADGSRQVQLTDSPAYDLDPVWSPDGQSIFFASERDGGREIYRMNADGSQETRLTVESEYSNSLALSPDGSKVLFSANKKDTLHIYTMNPDGTALARLTDRASTYQNKETNPVWSPDGRQIAFVGLEGISSMPADGSRPPFSHNTPTVIGDFTWSPDSKTIAFSSWKGLYILDVENSKIQLLFETPDALFPTWSPACGNCP